MDVNCHNANPVNAEQPSTQSVVGRKRGAEGTLGDAEWLAKKPVSQ